MAAPKARLDVWKPKLKNADGTVIEPDRWVTCQTYEDLTTNKRRNNALTRTDIRDVLYEPRSAKLSISNRCHDFKTVYDATNSTTRAATSYTYVYNDSDGNSAHSGNITLAHNWGLFTNFFYEFQHVRVIDQQTNLVLFTGRIQKIDKRYEDSMGSLVVIECIDALDELRHIPCKNLQKKVTFPYASGSEWHRSDMIQYALNLGLNFQAANVMSQDANGASRPDNSMATPIRTPLSGAINLNSDNNAGSAAANLYTRFEQSATPVTHEVVWELEKTGNKSLFQEMIRFAIAEPHEDESADDQFGYNFFLDPNYGQYNLDATKGPGVAGWNPPMVNYSKRGNRLSTATQYGASGSAANQDPNVWGLKVHMPLVNSVVSQGHRGTGGSVETASKVMQRAFDFANPKEELFTGAILTYEARNDNQVDSAGDTDEPAKIVRNKEFEICFVNYIDGVFTYRKKNIDDEWKKDNLDVPGTNSAEYLHAYQDNGSGAAGTLIANNVARVQYQSSVPTNGNTGASPHHYLLLSDISKNFPDAADQASATHVILKGATSNTICRFNAKATEAEEGRPRDVWGVRKIFSRTQMNITRPDELRIEIASRLAQASTQVRRGNFRVSKAPYYWLDCYIRAESTVSGGQEIQVAHAVDGASINVTPYGFREGMLIQKMTTGWIAMAKSSGKDVYGYCWEMGSSYAMKVNLTESVDFAVGDYVRLIIPIRAGDVIRVDNTLGDVFADHVLTEVHYNESMGPITELESIGNNEIRKGNPKKPNVWSELYDFEGHEEQTVAKNTTSRSSLAASYSGTFAYEANDRLSWTAGNVTTADGKTYQIVASDTSDGTYGVSGGMTGTNKYVMYLDPDGENPNSNQYHVKTVLLADYKQDADNIRLAVVSPSSTSAATPNMWGDQLTKQGDGTPLKSEASNWVHLGTITETLIGDDSITTAKIAANQIVANHIGANQITAGKINAGEINATKLTTSFAAEVQGKAKTFAQDGIPTSTTIGDIWIDTNDDNKIYRAASAGADAITAGEWILVNDAVTTANAANSAVASKTTTHRQNENWKDSNNGVQVGDTLVAVDTHRIWTWTSGSNWALRDDPGAINNASTTINGGRIDTQAIVLTSGGGQCLSTGNAQGSGTRVLLSNAGIYGWNGGTSQFGIATSDGKAYFSGGIIKMASDGMTIGQANVSSSAGAGAAIFKYVSGSSTYTYNMSNYLGILYISVSGVSNPALSPTNSNQFGLGTSTFGFKQLYLGQSSGATEKLWSDGGTLKWGNTAVGTAGSAIINSGKNDYIAVYKDDSTGSSSHSTTIGDTDSGTIYLGGTIIPDNDGGYSIGLMYQGGGSSDKGFKSFAGWESSLLGNPPFSFSEMTNTGMSFRESGGASFVNFETNDTDILRVGLHKIEVRQGGIVPSANNTRHIGSNTTNVWTTTYGSDLRFSSGNFKDFSTTRKAHFHYAVGSVGESSGGYAIDEDASRVHISCPLYYDNVHYPLSGGGESTADMEIIYYNNSNKHKMVRAASSARFKDNIRDLEIDTSKVWDLQPRSFEWKGDGTTAFGLIAEEVDEILPGLVAKYAHGDSDEVVPQSVHYKFLSVLLLAEMKELKARIEELEKE